MLQLQLLAATAELLALVAISSHFASGEREGYDYPGRAERKEGVVDHSFLLVGSSVDLIAHRRPGEGRRVGSPEGTFLRKRKKQEDI